MLTELPWDMALMTELKNLDVSHNPLVIPPRPVIQKGTEAILEWIKKNEKEGRKGKVSGLGMKEEQEPSGKKK